jgi:hypothetical protein
VAPTEAEARRAEGDRAGRLETENGFSAQLDRLRMLWYRHIVNFDRADQQNLVRSFKDKTEQSSQRLRDGFQKTLRAIADWMRGPWNVGRFAPVGLGALGIAAGLWWWRRYGRNLWISSRKSGRSTLHPVRREAGRWLKRFEAARNADATPRETVRSAKPDTSSEAGAVIFDLQRLRYAAPESWPEPAAVFRRARRAVRAAHLRR